MKITAIVPAAGAGERLTNVKKGRRKPFFIVRNRPILIHTLLALENTGLFSDIIVAVHRDDIARCKNIIKRHKLKKIKKVVPGGKTRFDSVRKGLAFVDKDSDIVLIHDGVRPLVDKRIISNSIKVCKRFGAAVAAVPALSTVKMVGRDRSVKSTPDRKRLYIVQTPQVFKKDIILKAYKRPLRNASSITDDSILVERLGYKVKVASGSYENIKVTTPQDLILVEMILRKRKTKSEKRKTIA